MPAPLPDQLNYLACVLNEFAKMSPEDFGDDVDTTAVEESLRGRVHGLNIREAQQRIKEDRAALENWLKDSATENDAGAWLLAFLGYRPGTLARRLLEPARASKDPIIIFEPPVGWSTESSPLVVSLRQGRKYLGGIWITDKAALASHLNTNEARQEAHARTSKLVGIIGGWTNAPVKFGEVHGQKLVYQQTAPVPWKRVEYWLEVPGGAANLMLDASGEDFDETELEAKLHTLQITPAD